MESIIRAPAAGTILTRTVNPGDPVVPLTSYQPGTELATIADMSDLIFKGTVDEIDVGKLHVGMPARIKVGALPDRRRHRAGLPHRAAGPAEGRRDALRRRDRARTEPEDHAARRLLGQRRRHHPREERRSDRSPSAWSPSRTAARKPASSFPAASPKVEPKKVEVKIGISDGMNVEVRLGPDEGREGRRAAAEGDLEQLRRSGARRMLSLHVSLRQLLRDIALSQKLRTFLTIFGIVWGTVAVTLLLAFGKGLQEQHDQDTCRASATASCIAWPGLTSIPFEGLGKGRRIRVTEDDIAAVRARGRRAHGASRPSTRENMKVDYGTKTIGRGHLGVEPEFGVDAQPDPAGGRAFHRRPRHAPSSGASSSSATSSPRTSSATAPVGKTVMVEQLAVPRRRRDAEESPGLELQRPRQRQGVHPGTTYRALPARNTSTTSSSRPQVPVDTEAITKRRAARRSAARLRSTRRTRKRSSIWDTTEQFQFFDTFMLAFRAFLGIIGVVHARRRRHRRVEHHERRRRGADEARSASRWPSARSSASSCASS